LREIADFETYIDAGPIACLQHDIAPDPHLTEV
jgi:hypothetical protein